MRRNRAPLDPFSHSPIPLPVAPMKSTESIDYACTAQEDEFCLCLNACHFCDHTASRLAHTYKLRPKPIFTGSV